MSLFNLCHFTKNRTVVIVRMKKKRTRMKKIMIQYTIKEIIFFLYYAVRVYFFYKLKMLALKKKRD